MFKKFLNWLKFKEEPETPSHPEMILVVGGTYRQAAQYVEQLKGDHDPSHYRFRAVATSRDIRGSRLRPNSVVYAGTFYERHDLAEIAEIVAAATRLPLK